jgi:hypothetical protein
MHDINLFFFTSSEEYNVDGMSSDYDAFTQDYWMNSLAIGHPLVFQSNATMKNSESKLDMSEAEVRDN